MIKLRFKNNRKTNQIMMVGPNMFGKGGISSVVKGYLDSGMLDRLGIDYYQTHLRGGRLLKLFFFIRAVITILIYMPYYSLIHIHTASMWSFRRKCVVMIMGGILRKPVILHLHGGKFIEYYREVSLMEKKIVSLAFKKAQTVVVLSKEIEKRVLQMFPYARTTVVPNSICITATDETSRNEKSRGIKNIAFMGELIWRKGVYDLIDVFADLAAKRDDIVLTLCGLGERRQIEKRVSKLNLKNRVFLPGWVEDEEKKKIYENAFLLVLPSYAESMPMCILEAFASATPVVATDVGGISDMIRDGVNGFLVEPGNIDMLKGSIERIIDDLVLWDGLSKRAYFTTLHSFSMTKTEKIIRKIYKRHVQSYHL